MDGQHSAAMVWLLDSGLLEDATLASWLPLLGGDEQARYARFVRRERCRQFIAGRVLLRQLAGQSAGVPPVELTITERHGQAPLLFFPPAFRSPFYFSLSHSGPWVACAISTHAALGLDIEILDPARDIDALAAQAFSAEECAALQGLPPQERRMAFYRLWSRYEARIKVGLPSDHAAAGEWVLAHPQLSIAVCSADGQAAPPVLKTMAPDALIWTASSRPT